MMKLLFLGSGSAFTVGADNYHANILLINEQNQKLLLDCGSDIRFSLNAEGFSFVDITDIYISHLHSDHVGGLEYIGLNTKFNPRCSKPNLYLSKELAYQLWENTLAGGMRYVQGDINSLDSFFKVHCLKPEEGFSWSQIQFTLVKVTHIDSGWLLMPSYGLFFEIGGKKILLTTDTQACFAVLDTYYHVADLIFHDCEISPVPTTVHAHYQELVTLPPSIKQKMWLYGYQPGKLPNASQDGFLGFVKRGQVFEF